MNSYTREIEEDQTRNLKQRSDFIIRYAKWVKRTPNRIWSKQQKEMIESVLRVANRVAKEGVHVKE